MEAMHRPLLEVEGLSVKYRSPRAAERAVVDDVTFEVRSGQTVGLVGESGAGKSTIGRALLGLAPITAGRVVYAGEDITRATSARRRQLSSEIQVVFQDPYGSLNPARTIGQTLGENLAVHGHDRASIGQRVEEMLARVGLPGSAADRYPRDFSGGQRQRIAIARALMASPRFVICDEPVSALDLSVQAHVLNLLLSLQAELGLSYLFIAHDLPVVRLVSDGLIVLYGGRIMEEGPPDQLYEAPAHPYTRQLIEAIPATHPRNKRLRTGVSRGPSGASDGIGCPFADRCPHATAVCREVTPPLEARPGGGSIACHHWATLGRFTRRTEVA
jgi:oligopeptide/dipeptide ABC transporter ATP-binding protein